MIYFLYVVLFFFVGWFCVKQQRRSQYFIKGKKLIQEINNLIDNREDFTDKAFNRRMNALFKQVDKLRLDKSSDNPYYCVGGPRELKI